MAHVPDQPVFGRIENVMQRDGEFHHSQSGGEMAAGAADGFDQEIPQLRRQHGELRFGERAEVLRRIQRIQNEIGIWADHVTADNGKRLIMRTDPVGCKEPGAAALDRYGDGRPGACPRRGGAVGWVHISVQERLRVRIRLNS